MKHWTPPKGDDATLKAAIETVTEPLEMLECLIANSEFLGTDPYYRDINAALWRAATRVMATPAPPKGFVITANDSVEAICLGTEAEAETICKALEFAYDEKQMRERGLYGKDRQKYHAVIHWAVRERSILS